MARSTARRCFSGRFATGSQRAEVVDDAPAGPDARKARLDVTQLNTEAGKRSDC